MKIINFGNQSEAPAYGGFAFWAGQLASTDPRRGAYADKSALYYDSDGRLRFATGAGSTAVLDTVLTSAFSPGWKPVRLVATANLVGTYAAGVFTVTAAGALSVDGVAVAVGDRILLPSQTTALQKGIYVVTTAGAPAVQPVLRRAYDAWYSSQFVPGKVVVAGPEGGTLANTQYSYQGAASPTIGTTALTFATTGSATVSFAAVQTALAAATGAVDFNGQDITGVPNIGGAAGITLNRGATAIIDIGVTGAAIVTLAANKNFACAAGTTAFDLSLGTGTFKTSTGAVTLGGSTTLAANKNLDCAAGTTAVDLSLGTGTFKTTTGAHTIGGAVTLAANKGITYSAGTGEFDASLGTGVFKTTTGAVSINGSATLAVNKNLDCLAGTTAVDFSLGTGIFKTPTGAATIGGGAAAIGITSSGAAITITAGAASTISTTVGTQTISGKTGIALQRDGASIVDVGATTSTDLTVLANKFLTLAVDATLQVKGAGTGTGDVVARYGATTTEGLEIVVFDDVISPAAVETNVLLVPANSVIYSVQGNCQAALTGGGTTATWSLGTAATPNKYGTAGDGGGDSLAQNSKSNWTATPTRLASAEQIVLTGCATGGAADGDTALTVGSVRVRVVYATCNALDNA